MDRETLDIINILLQAKDISEEHKKRIILLQQALIQNQDKKSNDDLTKIILAVSKIAAEIFFKYLI